MTFEVLPLSVMASNQPVTVVELDLLSFLRQNIARKLAIKARAQDLGKTHPWVIRAVIAHFNLGLAPNRNFDQLVWRIANDQ